MMAGRYTLAQKRKMSSVLPVEIHDYVRRALEEDIGSGDVTTNSIVPPDASLRGRIVTKQDGVVAGLKVAEQVMLAIGEDITFGAMITDGSNVTCGAVLAEIKGSARALLTGERTALNFLGRMSGIATLTRQFVDA